MKRTLRLLYFIVVLGTTLSFLPAQGQTPRLVVQIIVGSMRADMIDRYREQLEAGGFRRLEEGAISYTEAYYENQQTLTPTSLATLTTGTMPTSHGIVGNHWWDWVDNSRVELIADSEVRGLEYHTGGGQFSPHQLIAPTLSESLMSHSPESRVVTIALEPESAIIMGGKQGMTFWMHPTLSHWRSSSYYLPVLPEWVKRYNKERKPLSYIMQPWQTLHEVQHYKNRLRSDILLKEPTRTKNNPNPSRGAPIRDIACELVYRLEYDRLAYTPAGNSAVFDFAKQAIAQFSLGGDEHPDLLNIYLDSPRRIIEAYGPESIEAEDMFYRLDRDLSDLLTYIYAQCKSDEVCILLSSDHGTSPSYDFSPRTLEQRFNVPQFEMILESFLDARYGTADQNWLLEYENQMVYLNHNLIYEKRLSLSDVQNEVATFVMQFRGVSHALSATAMRTSYFGSGYAQQMQNGFYPRRSGDVILNLMPGWIEKRDIERSTSGSMYRYDRHVPLMIYREGITPLRVERNVGITSVAPTMAHLLGIPAPAASEGEALKEVISTLSPQEEQE